MMQHIASPDDDVTMLGQTGHELRAAVNGDMQLSHQQIVDLLQQALAIASGTTSRMQIPQRQKK